MTKRVLIVDDEPDIRALIEITLNRMQLNTVAAENVTQAQEKLASERFDLVLTDMNMPDGNGIDLVAYIQKNHPATPVAVITAYGSIDTAISALKAGAFDFVSKPVDLARLRELVNSAIMLQPATAPPPPVPSKLLGHSKAMERLRGQIRKLARSQAPIYISGESGSGKEMVARSIHEQGSRSNGPFVPVNCGAIPSELMESEFFGHKKGAFTGAVENKEGLFKAADGGTLFLDEVADLPLTMQVKLLRAIQEKAVRPVGEQKETAVDVRILSATHKDLHQLVDEGLFRQDLFYRINVIELKVPSLRERIEDIELLSEHILRLLADECELPGVTLSKDALKVLQGYHFPGNVRELENILERAFTLSEEDEIQKDDIHLPVSDSNDKSGIVSELDVPAFDHEGDNLEHFLENIEKQAIEKALEETRWNKTAAAKKLGISFRALRYRLKKLGME
ncbi:sigma-54-dependent Fis family transcriptional regulator [Hahella sp. CCB-MM4]|uniref:sigma-54-dependent transcriptional regulator n=1 Tax=Hahella sp. (strain CCB-MM4) TaxID=1926491 RepID=UPI000B9A5576|nr:sigma-54 dependent transcriptional regulator [Hahella sp. CCB-MM4]OZG71481.1 sigma-54-dependent Fis family transcriptional regulator [Hahella sp. CCB-MM4]